MAPAMPSSAPSSAVDQRPVLAERTTRGGRRLHYELTVLQQPERARACGSGQKSAADRRPVDPPPVVQLRVLEGPTLQESKDITFHYNANFFLYASLELARPMAHGRVQTPAATSPPVLTGMPVSGMAYLDRPAEAGYFLFPDLSVRHEGRYRLAFHLYEEIKEDRDRDAEAGSSAGQDPSTASLAASFDWRMEIKSVAFNVYSAKKFPGLTESTTLSRTVAEQGCRVRIRRDVRMRRRDGKSGNDYDNADDEYNNRSRRTQTPESSQHDQYRARSQSNASEHRTPYAPEQRRPSGVDAYAQPPPPPSYGPGPPSATSNVHLRFGSDASSAPYPPHQYSQSSAQPPPISPTTPYHSNQPSPYQSAPPQPGYGYSSRPSSQQYSSGPPLIPAHDPYDRRSSGAQIPPSPTHYGPKEMDFKREHEYRRESEYKREAEYKLEPEVKRDVQMQQPYPPPLSMAPSQESPSHVKLPPLEHIASQLPPPRLPPLSHDRSGIIEPGPSMPPVLSEPARAGAKRAYGQTFVENPRPLYHGQRPVDPHYAAHSHRAPAYLQEPTLDNMTYSRADGSEIRRPQPELYQ